MTRTLHSWSNALSTNQCHGLTTFGGLAISFAASKICQAASLPREASIGEAYMYIMQSRLGPGLLYSFSLLLQWV